MKLLFPEYLWALFAIAIPVIIHLFNFRKFQKVYFSNIDLLKEVKLETKSKSQLKHLVILALRILAIIALVIAFCQPYIPTTDSHTMSDNVISIYIDNSHSMDSKSTNGYRLELAKEQAEQIVESYGPTDVFQIITNDFEGRHQRLYNKTEAIQLIDEVTATFQSKKISDVFLREKDLFANETGNKTCYWLSDFQQKTTNFEAIQIDSAISIVCIPYYNEGGNNLYIDSIWFDTPVRKSGAEDQVNARVTNTSDASISFKMNLWINEENRAFINFDIEPQSSIDCKIPYTIHTNGVQNCKMTISDYPDASLTFDDDYYFSYNVRPSIHVVNIYEGAKQNDSSGYFGVLFGKNKQFDFDNTLLNSFDFSLLNGYDLVVLSNLVTLSNGMQSELKNYINNGGSICIFPASNANLGSYNQLLQEIANISLSPKVVSNTKVNKLYAEHPIYQGIFDVVSSNIDLPIVQEYYTINAGYESGSSKLMSLQNGKSFLHFVSNSKGNITICASPLDESASSFVKHALFVPTMLRVAEFSQFRNKYYYTVGVDNAIEVNASYNSSNKIEIKSKTDGMVFLPALKSTKTESNLLVYNQIKKAGNYEIHVDDKIMDGASFNYNRDESVQDFLNQKDLNTVIYNSAIGTSIQLLEGFDSEQGIVLDDITQGKKYWWQLILLALVLLGLEIAVFRLFP